MARQLKQRTTINTLQAWLYEVHRHNESLASPIDLTSGRKLKLDLVTTRGTKSTGLPKYLTNSISRSVTR